MKPGTVLIVAGAGLLIIGALWRWAPWTLSWFGTLPGDIRYRGENTTVFIPLASMLLVSIVLSLAVALFRRGS